jgi:hypothetical protein
LKPKKERDRRKWAGSVRHYIAKFTVMKVPRQYPLVLLEAEASLNNV